MQSALVTLCVFLAVLVNATAQTPPPSPAATSDAPWVNPCLSAPFTDFDMWVGDWVAIDWETGIVQGVDRIEKIADGCALHQDWTQLTDRYRSPGAPMRYFGNSLSAPLPRGGWMQMWVNQGGGGATVLTGGLNEEGVMELATQEFPLRDGRIGRQVWYWQEIEDGQLHSWGEIQIRGADEAEYSDVSIPWNLRYVPRADAPNLTAAPQQPD